MNVPVRFQSDTNVILEEVARFRALTSQERMQSIRSILNAGDLILQKSPKAAWLIHYSEEQELLAQQLTREFLTRHEHATRSPLG